MMQQKTCRQKKCPGLLIAVSLASSIEIFKRKKKRILILCHFSFICETEMEQKEKEKNQGIGNAITHSIKL